MQIFQRAELALKMKLYLAEQAKKRQATSTGGASPQLVMKSRQAEKGKTNKKLAEIANVGQNTIEKASVILNRGTDDQKRRAREGGRGNTIHKATVIHNKNFLKEPRQ